MDKLNKKEITELLPHREPMLLIDELVNIKAWTDRIKEARIRLLVECRRVDSDTPIKKVLYEEDNTPKVQQGIILQGCHGKRGDWLTKAFRDEQEFKQRKEERVREQ